MKNTGSAVTTHNVSPYVQWHVIKFNNVFLKKQGNIKLSCEPGNITGRHGYKWNGLVHRKSIDVQPANGNKGVAIKMRIPRKINKVKHQYRNIELRKSKSRTLKSIRKLIGTDRYRQDIKSATLKKACVILRSQEISAKNK